MPSFEFSSLTGRLQESKRFQPLNPISPTPLHSAEVPNMIYDTVNTKPVTTGSTRGMSGSSDNPIPAKMLKTMEQMQKNMDTVPVFLIKGKQDKILFGLTAVSVATGAILSVAFVLGQAFRRKN